MTDQPASALCFHHWFLVSDSYRGVRETSSRALGRRRRGRQRARIANSTNLLVARRAATGAGGASACVPVPVPVVPGAGGLQCLSYPVPVPEGGSLLGMRYDKGAAKGMSPDWPNVAMIAPPAPTTRLPSMNCPVLGRTQRAGYTPFQDNFAGAGMSPGRNPDTV